MGEVDSGQTAGLERLNLNFLLQLLQAREALRLGGIHPREGGFKVGEAEGQETNKETNARAEKTDN